MTGSLFSLVKIHFPNMYVPKSKPLSFDYRARRPKKIKNKNVELLLIHL
jgi:hypothetical protein